VVGGDIAVRGRDLVGPFLHRWALDLDTLRADATDQVVVMLVAFTVPVEMLAAFILDGVKQSFVCECLEVAIDRGEAGRL
jgi:hypothetical protein